MFILSTRGRGPGLTCRQNKRQNLSRRFSPANLGIFPRNSGIIPPESQGCFPRNPGPGDFLRKSGDFLPEFQRLFRGKIPGISPLIIQVKNSICTHCFLTPELMQMVHTANPVLYVARTSCLTSFAGRHPVESRFISGRSATRKEVSG